MDSKLFAVHRTYGIALSSNTRVSFVFVRVAVANNAALLTTYFSATALRLFESVVPSLFVCTTTPSLLASGSHGSMKHSGCPGGLCYVAPLVLLLPAFVLLSMSSFVNARGCFGPVGTVSRYKSHSPRLSTYFSVRLESDVQCMYLPCQNFCGICKTLCSCLKLLHLALVWFDFSPECVLLIYLSF